MNIIFFILFLFFNIYTGLASELILIRETQKIDLNDEFFGLKIITISYEGKGYMKHIYLSKDKAFYAILGFDNIVELSKKKKEIFTRYEQLIRQNPEEKENIEKERKIELDALFENVSHTLTISYKGQEYTYLFKYKNGDIIIMDEGESKTFSTPEFFEYISSGFSNGIDKFLNLWKCDCEQHSDVCHDETCKYIYENIYIPCKDAEKEINIECPVKPENAKEKIFENKQIIYFKK